MFTLSDIAQSIAMYKFARKLHHPASDVDMKLTLLMIWHEATGQEEERLVVAHTCIGDDFLPLLGKLKLDCSCLFASDLCLFSPHILCRLDCFCHCAVLPPIPSPPIKVEIRGSPRSNAKAKDSEWVRDRKHLEDLKPPDVNEIILHDEKGALFEGSQTNFYAIQGGKVWT